MRPLILALALVGCSQEPPPEPRLAYQQLEAPYMRFECRNHQYWIIDVDAHGRERETNSGQFCEITE